MNQGLEHEERLGDTRVRWLRLRALPEHVSAWLEGPTGRSQAAATRCSGGGARDGVEG